MLYIPLVTKDYFLNVLNLSHKKEPRNYFSSLCPIYLKTSSPMRAIFTFIICIMLVFGMTLYNPLSYVVYSISVSISYGLESLPGIEYEKG